MTRTQAYFVAECHENGDCFDQDSMKALHYYEQSSDGGNILASYRLWRAYTEGDLGVRANPVKAARYARRLGETPT